MNTEPLNPTEQTEDVTHAEHHVAEEQVEPTPQNSPQQNLQEALEKALQTIAKYEQELIPKLKETAHAEMIQLKTDYVLQSALSSFATAVDTEILMPYLKAKLEAGSKIEFQENQAFVATPNSEKVDMLKLVDWISNELQSKNLIRKNNLSSQNGINELVELIQPKHINPHLKTAELHKEKLRNS